MQKVFAFIKDEPVLIGGLITALVAMGYSFATHPIDEWAGAIQAVVLAGTAIAIAWGVRQNVTPVVAKVKLDDLPSPFIMHQITRTEEAASRASVSSIPQEPEVEPTPFPVDPTTQQGA